MATRWTTKAWLWRQVWWQTTVRDTIAPFTEPSALFNAALSVAVVGTAIWGGERAWGALNTMLSSVPSGVILLGGLALFFVMNCVVAAVKTGKTISALGVWNEKGEFIYHHPQHLLTVQVAAADTGKSFPFFIEQPSAGAHLELEVRAEGFGSEEVAIQIRNKPSQPLPPDVFMQQAERWSALTVLPENRTLYVMVKKPPMSNTSILKIYLLRWGVIND